MNIFVSQLSYGVNDADLNELFAEYGTVNSAKVIMDRETGRSRGFGFVEMEEDVANTAIEALNGAEFGGRTIKVNEAKEREQTERRFDSNPRRYNGGGGGNRGYGDRGGYGM